MAAIGPIGNQAEIRAQITAEIRAEIRVPVRCSGAPPASLARPSWPAWHSSSRCGSPSTSWSAPSNAWRWRMPPPTSATSARHSRRRSATSWTPSPARWTWWPNACVRRRAISISTIWCTNCLCSWRHPCRPSLSDRTAGWFPAPASHTPHPRTLATASTSVSSRTVRRTGCTSASQPPTGPPARLPSKSAAAWTPPMGVSSGSWCSPLAPAQFTTLHRAIDLGPGGMFALVRHRQHRPRPVQRRQSGWNGRRG